MYIVKRITEYPDGMRLESYIESIGHLVTLSGRIKDAKRYQTKAAAKKDIATARDGRRMCREYYEILTV